MIQSLINHQLAGIYDCTGVSRSEPPLPVRELDTVLGLGVLVYQNLRRHHWDWHAEVEAGRQPYQVEDAESLADEYRRWMSSTEFWLDQARRSQAGGERFASFTELSRCFDEVRHVELDVGKMLAIRQEMEQGGGIPWDDVYADLKQRCAS